MLKSVQLQIPKTCHENWNNMTPVEQGRFCGACQKTVVDFSAMSEEELLDHVFKVAGQQTCGRFSNHQLNADIKVKENKRQILWAYVWNLLFASLLTTESYARGESSIMKKPDVHFSDRSSGIDAVAVTKQDTVPNNKLVQGFIIQSKTNKPVPYAYVMIKGSSKGVVCDKKGEFRMMIESNNTVTLEVSCVGYKSQTLAINESSPVQNISVLMDEAITELMGDFVVVNHYTFKQKVKKFFKRTVIAPFKKL